MPHALDIITSHNKLQFVDNNQQDCSITRGIGKEPSIWIGTSINPMELSQHQLGQLMPILEHFHKTGKVATVEGILTQVAGRSGFSVEEIKGICKEKPLVYVRWIAMREVTHKLNLSCVKVGKIFNRYHSSIIYALNNLEYAILNYEDARTINDLITR